MSQTNPFQIFGRTILPTAFCRGRQGHYNLKYVLLAFLSVFGFSATTSTAKNIEMPQNYTILQDLTEDWLVYDDSYGGYVPYMKNRHTKLKTLSFWLEVEKYKAYRLLFFAEKDTYLYIDKRLAYKFDKTGWHHLSVDSLQKVYQNPHLFCTFYDAQYRLPLPTLAIVIHAAGKQASNMETDRQEKITFLDRTPRPEDYKDWGLLSFLVIVILYTVLFNYNPKIFSSFFSERSSLSTRSRKDPNLIQKPLNMVNFIYMGVHGLLLSYFYMLWAVVVDNQAQFLWIPFKSSVLGLTINQFYYWLLAWGILVGKMLLLLFFGRLLSVDRQVIHVHLFEYVRFSYLFYTAWAILGALVFCAYSEYNVAFFNLSTYFIVFFHLFQAIRVSFFVIKQIPFLNLYIFYYLCTTELTPWLIGVKLLFFS
jgi:hypothetical protein